MVQTDWLNENRRKASRRTKSQLVGDTDSYHGGHRRNRGRFNLRVRRNTTARFFGEDRGGWEILATITPESQKLKRKKMARTTDSQLSGRQ